MAKRRRKGAGRSTRRASTPQQRERRPAKRRSAPSAAVTTDDEEVWMGPAKIVVTGPASLIHRQSPAAKQQDDDDEDVWMAPRTPVRPMAPDWMREKGLAQRDPLLQAAIDALDLEVVDESWRCRYGCRGLRMPDDGPMIHHYACAFWEREGKELVPF